MDKAEFRSTVEVALLCAARYVDAQKMVDATTHPADPINKYIGRGWTQAYVNYAINKVCRKYQINPPSDFQWDVSFDILCDTLYLYVFDEVYKKEEVNATNVKWWEHFALFNALFGDKKIVSFAILGLPDSGKTHFINIVRGEPYRGRQTDISGKDIIEKRITIRDKTFIFKRTKDINGKNLIEYPMLIKNADLIFFFFRADYYAENRGLQDIDYFSEKDKSVYSDYPDIVRGYLGSVLRDQNSQGKKIIIVASFKKNLGISREESLWLRIKDDLLLFFNDVNLENCEWHLADIDDDHRNCVIDNVKRLVFG